MTAVTPIPLPPIPSKGIVRLLAGADYLIPAGGANARSCTFVKQGSASAPNPKLHYAGPQTAGVRETAAMLVPAGCSAQFFDIDFDCPGWSYCVTNEGTLETDGVRVKGGGGLLRVNGASGTTLFARYSQLESSEGYCFYGGPKELVTKDSGGKILSYDEAGCGPISLLGGTGLLGSRQVALSRFQAFERLIVRDANWSDRASQSAPGAVPNAVLRVHHGGDAQIQGNFQGDIYLGPLAEGDGGAALPPGPQRSFDDAKRLRSVTIEDSSIAIESSFKLTPGVLNCELVRCAVAGVSSVAQPFPYMNRPKSVLKLQGTTFTPAAAGGSK